MRVAACVVGQVRALPLAYMNWKLGQLLQVLASGGMTVDFFVVTSNTTSLTFWKDAIQMLRPVQMVVTEPTIDVRKEPRSPWAFRKAGGKLQFNIARFPWYRDQKVASSLVQHWQLYECGRLIMKQENATGVRYTRAARLRSDVIFSTKLSQLSGFRTFRACSLRIVRRNETRFQQCIKKTVERLRSERAALAVPCERHLADLQARQVNWYMLTDLYLIGSRDALVDGIFQGMRFLTEAKQRDKLRINRVAYAWHEIQRRTEERFAAHRGLSLGPRRAQESKYVRNFSASGIEGGGLCNRLLGQADIVRLAGPPVLRYYLEFSGTGNPLRRVGSGPKRALSEPLMIPWCMRHLSREFCLQFVWGLSEHHTKSCWGVGYQDLPLQPPQNATSMDWLLSSKHLFQTKALGDHGGVKWTRAQELVRFTKRVNDGF